MVVTTYDNAGDFLQRTQDVLEKNESANGLMLDICFRLRRFPEEITATPYLATVDDVGQPVVAAVMTPPHKLVIYSEEHECEKALEILAQDLWANRWVVPAVFGSSHVAKAFAGTWTKVSGAPYVEGKRQRIYELRKVIHPEAIRGRLRLATEDDLELVSEWFLGFQKEAMVGGELGGAREVAENNISNHNVYLWEDGEAVSMAMKARPTSHGIAVSGVYTPPELRRRGYATACVASLSQLLLDSGRQFCCLFTDLSNPTSNHIYQTIGYRPVCDFTEYVSKPESKLVEG